MVKKARKRYDAAFKEKVVLEAMKEQKTLSQIASEFGIHANQVSQWKQQAVSHQCLCLVRHQTRKRDTKHV